MNKMISQDFDAVVVGGGFAGLYMLHRLRQLGLSARVFEAGDGVGGTWFWNRYPGARCDVESQEYSYSFSEELQDEWQWTERYASQPEILRYLNYFADRFDLRGDIQLKTRVTAARFDEHANRWKIETDRGTSVSARFCIFATGCLSTPKTPEYKGLETFQGRWYQTARWPRESIDFSGQRVGVIGTGSSGIQCIPMIAREAAHLIVFQRTPNFSMPANNGPIAKATAEAWKARRAEYRQMARTLPFGVLVEHGTKPASEATTEERQAEYEKRWQRGGLCLYGAYPDLFLDRASNDSAAEFVRSKIQGIVRDPTVADKLLPKTYPIGTKRLCVDTGYYETFNRENVTLVDTRESPIQEITPRGIRTASSEYSLDSIVFATGFDAITGALSQIDIRGRHGIPLQQKWSAGPRTYLGLSVAGFPNLFVVTGPGSPSVLSNMVPSIEQHAGWIARCIGWLRDHGRSCIEASEAAQDAWVAHGNEIAAATLFPSCNSWYLGANVPGKPRVFMPYLGFPEYVKKCDEVAAKGYEGFETS